MNWTLQIQQALQIFTRFDVVQGPAPTTPLPWRACASMQVAKHVSCYRKSIKHISKCTKQQQTNCWASCTLLVARGGPLGTGCTGISRSAKFGGFGFDKLLSEHWRRLQYESMRSLSCYLLPSANWRPTNWSKKYVHVHVGSFGFWHISEALRHARDPNYEGTSKHSLSVPR